MAIDPLERLNLDHAQVTRAIEFLRDYAATVMASSSSRQSETDAWLGQAEAASALRDAAQLTLLIDLAGGRALLAEAGARFWELGYPYGAYLAALGGEVGLARAEADRLIDDGLGEHREGDRHDLAGAEAPVAPQQRAYQMLAACGAVRHDGALADTLRSALERSEHRDGAVPVGALGTPIRAVWAVALALMGDAGDGHGPEVIGEHVAAMCGRYTTNVEVAMGNRHLWDHVAAPVDLVDLEITGIVSLAVGRFGRSAVEERLLADARTRGLAAVPIDIGLRLTPGPTEGRGPGVQVLA